MKLRGIQFGWDRLSVEWWCAIAAATLRTAVCGYRAATQTITHDEAFSFLRFINGPLESLWSAYDAANHVLFSALAKFSIALFGLSDLTLRLPSVLAGFGCAVGVFAVLTFCQSRMIRWVAFAGLMLHPLLLDFHVAARGYGLAISLLVWAIYFVMKDRPIQAGAMLGLALAANLSMAFPGLALVVSQPLLRKQSGILPALKISAAAAVVALAICAYPMRTMQRSSFYVGTGTLQDAFFNLIYSSSIHTTSSDGLFGSASTADVIRDYGIPLLAVTWILLGFYLWWKRPKAGLLLTTPAMLLISSAGLLVAHVWLEVPYPIDRTGLYLILLGGLAWPLLADLAPWPAVRYAHIVVAGLLTAQFATQFQTAQFPVWWYNNGAKQVAQWLDREIEGRAPESVSIGLTWLQQPVMEYYRIAYAMDALQPVQRTDPTEFTGHDYYILNPPDTMAPEVEEMEILFQPDGSDMIVAARGR